MWKGAERSLEYIKTTYLRRTYISLLSLLFIKFYRTKYLLDMIFSSGLYRPILVEHC